MTLKTPKGTRDFYPDLMSVQQYMFSVWRKVCNQFGFEEYDSPTFEHLELYTQKSGQEIVSQLYHFKDKAGRDLALRPEMTPTLARMINQKGPALKLPVKWFSIPRLYRYEKSQKGRLREFCQLNMDIIGTKSIWADIDLILAVVEMLKALGLTEKDFYVGLSNRKLLSDFLSSLGIEESLKTEVYGVLDKRAKVKKEAFIKMLSDLKISEENCESLDQFFNCKNITDLKTFCDERGIPEAALELVELFDHLEKISYTSFVELDLSVVRGLAYYTGTVFEVLDRKGEMRAIAGGGRYDNLLKSLGGKDVTGVGFGIGDVVLADMLSERNLLPLETKSLDYYVVTFAGVTAEMMTLVKSLRARDYSVAYSFEPGKMKKQLADAEKAGSKKVIFFGSDKPPAGSFEVKDMQTREQSVVAEDKL